MDSVTFRSAMAEAAMLRAEMAADAVREARFRLAVANAQRDVGAIDRWTAVNLMLIDLPHAPGSATAVAPLRPRPLGAW